MTTDLHGRVALVTGAARGWAPRMRGAWQPRGHRGRQRHHRQPPAARLAAKIGGHTAVGDVSDPEECVRLTDDVVQAAGGLDILVANHAYMTMAPLLEHDPDDWWKVVDTNLGGTFFLVQAALPHLRARGGGRIVVVTSEWGVTGWPAATAYAAAKSGLIALVKTLGRELAAEHIIVNAVAPG